MESGREGLANRGSELCLFLFMTFETFNLALGHFVLLAGLLERLGVSIVVEIVAVFSAF